MSVYSNDKVVKRKMKESVKNVSIYYCDSCEGFFGIFYAWHEVEHDNDANICPVCLSDDHNKLFFLKDSEGTNID